MTSNTPGLEAMLGEAYDQGTMQDLFREILRQLGDLQARSPVTASGAVGSSVTNTTSAGAIPLRQRVTFTGADGLPAAGRHVRVWLSNSSGGPDSATAPSGGTTLTRGTSLAVITAGLAFEAALDSSGAVELAVTHNAARTWYLVASLDGRIVAGPPLIFT